jgi:hypothetical protein
MNKMQQIEITGELPSKASARAELQANIEMLRRSPELYKDTPLPETFIDAVEDYLKGDAAFDDKVLEAILTK